MVTWRVCIVVVTALLFVFFGDLLGLSMGKDRKMPVSRQSPTLRDDQPTIYLDSRSKKSPNDLSGGVDSDLADAQKEKIITMSRDQHDACLPKMLCEIAAKSPEQLIDSERQLLGIIRSSSLSPIVPETTWHFAAHMGQLMRDSVDPRGCANLWPTCPFSSKILNQLNIRLA